MTLISHKKKQQWSCWAYSIKTKSKQNYEPMVLKTSGNEGQWPFRDRKQIM